jgi:hypothetical protein
MNDDFSLNLFCGPEKGRLRGTDVTRTRARAEEDVRSVHLLIGSMPAVSSGMRGWLSEWIHVAGRSILPPASLSVLLQSSASAQTVGTAGSSLRAGLWLGCLYLSLVVALSSAADCCSC